MKDDRKLKKQADTLTDDDMDNVTGGMVNESGSIPNSVGLSLEPVNTSKDIEELRKNNSPSIPFPQNCN